MYIGGGERVLRQELVERGEGRAKDSDWERKGQGRGEGGEGDRQRLRQTIRQLWFQFKVPPG